MTQRTLALAACLAAVAVLPRWTDAQVQQQAPRRLEPSTSSAEARVAFAAALDHANNVFPLRARGEAAKAVAADPNFGLARVLLANASPDMPAAQRAAEMDRGVADASRGSPGEFLYAAALRSNSAGRTAEAHTLTAAAASFLPDDPSIALLYAFTTPAAQQTEALREVTRRFPEFAPPYNTLAYQMNTAGDRNGALQMVQMYVRLAPSAPNPHDSYAELLQFGGKYSEALAHYEAAARADSAFDQAYAGMGEVHLLMGHGDQARAAYAVAVDRAPTVVARLNSQAARALTYVAEGKAREALRELPGIAASAEQQNQNGTAAGLNRAIALLQAAFGDRAAVAGALAKAAALGGADVPAQHRFTALTAALTGDVESAKAAAARFRGAVASGTAAQQNQSHEVDAIVAVAEKDLTTGQAELAKAGSAANLGRAVLAEALKKAGRKTEADALRAEILATGTVTLFDLVARAKVAKL